LVDNKMNRSAMMMTMIDERPLQETTNVREKVSCDRRAKEKERKEWQVTIIPKLGLIVG